MHDSYFLEDKLDESNLSKLKGMPFISKKALDEIKRDDQMGEEELPIDKLIEDIDELKDKEERWYANREPMFEGLE